jgi:hypothetical protein
MRISIESETDQERFEFAERLLAELKGGIAGTAPKAKQKAVPAPAPAPAPSGKRR